MDIINRNIWQQAAGDTDRNYADICLHWDVILNGPGTDKKWPDCKPKLITDWNLSRKISDLERFCEGMEEGDFVVLRLGTSTILGLGEIVGGYEHLRIFSDVDGWDLRHVRRVRWLLQSKTNLFDDLKTYDLKAGDTTQLVTSQKVIDWVSSLHFTEDQLNRKLIELPTAEESKSIHFDDISEFLYDKGVASDSINKLSDEIDELTRIAKWYKKFCAPSEHETIAYLAIPLLRALGWTPQKMAIEWNRVDVALFSKLPRQDTNLNVVVEAKKKDNSCLAAFSQAESYAKDKENCERLIVTDGIRYGVYLKKNEEFQLYAYLNLTEFKDNYPIYTCSGAQEAILSMTPEWIPEP